MTVKFVGLWVCGFVSLYWQISWSANPRFVLEVYREAGDLDAERGRVKPYCEADNTRPGL